MATIRANCTACGDVDLVRADVRVRVCRDDERAEYRFSCPICRMTVVKAAEPRTIDLLVATGVRVDVWSLPAELHEPRHGEPISHSDLLDFHELLKDDAAFAAALEGITGR